MVGKLLFVVPDFYPNCSGYANACTGFVQAVAKRGALSVDVLTLVELHEKEELKAENVNIIRLKTQKYLWKLKVIVNEFRLWRNIVELSKINEYDFIIFETAEFPLAGLLSLGSFGNKVIVRVHACAETEWVLFRKEPIYLLKRYPTKILFKKLKNIFSTSNYYIHFIEKYFLGNNPLLISSKYFQVIPQSLIFPPENAENFIAKEYPCLFGEFQNNIVLLTLGRMDYHGELQKNFTRVLIAISLLKNTNYFKSLRLIMVGDGNYKNYLQKLSSRLGINDKIIFYDFLPNGVIRYLQKNSHGIILASTFEGLSMFALESLHEGAPLLFSDRGGLKDLVDPGVNGVLFNPMDPYDIANKIDCYIKTMLPNIDIIRNASIVKFINNFSEEKVVNKFIDNLNILVALSKDKDI